MTKTTRPPLEPDGQTPQGAATRAAPGPCVGLLSALTNAVTVVLARSSLLCAEMEPAHPLAGDAVDLQRASAEAAELLQRLARVACVSGEA